MEPRKTDAEGLVLTQEAIETYRALTKLMNDLGYFVNKDGLCSGLNLSETDREQLELAAFCEGIMLFQSPSHLLAQNVLGSVDDRDITNIAKVTASAALAQKGGIQEVFNLEKTNLDENQWNDYFASLLTALQNQKANYGIVISTINHKMGIEYIKERNVWRLLDANQLPYKDIKPEDMGKQMRAQFNTHQAPNRIMTRIYTTPDQLELYPDFVESLNHFKQNNSDVAIPVQPQTANIPIATQPSAPTPSLSPAAGKYTVTFTGPSQRTVAQLTGDSLEQLIRNLLVETISSMKKIGMNPEGTITITKDEDDFEHKSQYSYKSISDPQTRYCLEYNDGGNFLLNREFEHAWQAVATTKPIFRSDTAKPFNQYNFENLTPHNQDSVIVAMLTNVNNNETLELLRNQTASFIYHSSHYLHRRFDHHPNLAQLAYMYDRVREERANLDGELKRIEILVNERLDKSGWKGNKPGKNSALSNAIQKLREGINIIRTDIHEGKIHNADDINAKLLPLIQSVIKESQSSKSSLLSFIPSTKNKVAIEFISLVEDLMQKRSTPRPGN